MTRPQPAQSVRPRSVSRAAAVQALYQMDLAGTDLNQVIAEFERERFAVAVDAADLAAGSGLPTDDAHEERLEGADAQFFADILRGVVRRQRDIDPLIDAQLAEGWRLIRVDSTLRAILRAGVFELMERQDVPARVAINEYINVAHAFFDEEEPRVVNGVLDRIARKLRGPEIPPAPKKA